MTLYNQLEQKETNNACPFYAPLNQFLVDYGVYLNDKSVIFSTLKYLASIKVFNYFEGASAKVFFPALRLYIKWKLGLDFKIVESTIIKMDLNKGWILGFKKANGVYVRNSKDSELTRDDIDQIKNSKGGSGHFHFWKKDTLRETLGGYDYKYEYTVLYYAYTQDLYYPTIRRFEPNPDDKKTVEICKKSIEMVKERRKSGFKNYFLTLDQFKDLFLKDDNKR